MLFAAALSLMCRLPSASVLIGQEAVIVKPACIKPFRQCVPCSSGFVREHQGHDAVRLQHTATLGEDRCHPFSVVPIRKRCCPFSALEFRRVGYRLMFLVRQCCAEQFRNHIVLRYA